MVAIYLGLQRERRIKSRDLFFCHIRVDRKRRQDSVSGLTVMISVAPAVTVK